MAASSRKIMIIGIGVEGLEGLTEQAQRLVLSADLLVGAESTLALISEPGRAEQQRIEAGDNLEEIIELLESTAAGRVVVLASGDPLFYGFARYLCERLGKERFEVVPHVSTMQLAFARVKESWDEAYLSNLATRPLEVVLERIRIAEKVGLFTTDQLTPAHVARALLHRGIDYFHGYVCENLGSPDERVTQGALEEIAGMDFAPLNCMILLRKPSVPDRPSDKIGQRLFGNPDEVFLQTKPKRGLLTPAEVRAWALAELDLGPESIVWDVGAGSGAVSIEAAQVASKGKVFAIEMDPEDHQIIQANAEKFGVTNLTAVLGSAPEAWQNLPDPDCIFIGGLGRQVERLIDLAYQRLQPEGRLVVNLGSIEGLAAVNRFAQEINCEPNVWMMQHSRGVLQLERIRFEASNPTFLVSLIRRS
ncbi:Cobalamin biosynthesis bifunctional protein CbiET [Planctomycetales bacterium 10988]|nr:Cobalamin biosynthesis bifunctional protein CbiET [Planctomycetales bacterium 10988]